MTNQGNHTIVINTKSKKQMMRVSQNRRAYEKMKKERPEKAKETLLNYYRKLYGESLVKDFVVILGISGAIEALKQYKTQRELDPLFHIKL